MIKADTSTKDILYVTKTSILGDGGGGEKRAREVVSGLAERGHNVQVVCGKTERGLRPTEQFAGSLIHHLKCVPDSVLDLDRVGFYLPRYLFALCSIPLLVRLLIRNDFDVVIENMTPYPTLTVVLARLFSVPIIAVQHEFHGHDCLEMYDPLTGRIQLVVQKILRIFKFDALVTPATHVKQELDEYGVATDWIEVVPNGIEYEKFARRDVERESGRLVTVGRLCNRKGQHDLLRAFADLQDEHPETHLDIVGKGPKRDELTELAVQLGIDDAVTFHGFVSEEEKVRLLNQADIFVFGSHQEGFGLVLLEAMASGCPVVARELPVYDEFFESGVNGQLISEPFTSEFSKEVSRLLENDGETKQIREVNRNTATRYGWHKTVDGMESVISVITATDANKRQAIRVTNDD